VSPEGSNVISDTVANMRDRAARCRRLAKATSDKQVAYTLVHMAEEIEADLQRLSVAEGNQLHPSSICTMAHQA
jgi:hypothetical protein